MMRGATMAPTPEAVRRDDQQHGGHVDADRNHLNIVLLVSFFKLKGPDNTYACNTSHAQVVQVPGLGPKPK